jgi:hypothetical protein
MVFLTNGAKGKRVLDEAFAEVYRLLEDNEQMKENNTIYADETGGTTVGNHDLVSTPKKQVQSNGWRVGTAETREDRLGK